MKKHSLNPLKILRSQKGVALLIALLAMTLMTFIAVEVSYDTSVDYVVASQQVNRIKAYYAAKSGVELSLLRIMLYKQIMSTIGDSLSENKSMLDPIWKFPFMWPPTMGDGDKMMETDKDIMKSAVDEAMMKAQYVTTISPEGALIDINDLGSDIKSLQEVMSAQIIKIFESEIENNEEFGKKYRGYRFNELVNNIADYIDEDSESRNGGEERALYREIDDKEIVLPPNRSLRTLDELHQVAKMTDDFYNVLANKVTIYGSKGINVNYAGREVLKALDPNLKDDVVNKILERRNDPNLGGPFKDDADFFGFIGGMANTKALQDSKVPLLYDMEYNFRIVSTGISGNVKRDITAITYDFANLKNRLGEMLDKRDQDESPGGTQQTTNTNAVNNLTGKPVDTGDKKDDKSKSSKAKFEATKGRPIVVYWEEN